MLSSKRWHSRSVLTVRVALTFAAVLPVGFGAFEKVSAAATDEERAAARNLAEKGRGAFEAKRFGDAIDLFNRAETLVHSPIHLLFLGRAYSAKGELVRAQEAFLKASREPLDASAPPARVQAVESARKELEAVRARVAEVTILVTGAEAAQMSIDGQHIADVLVGAPMPIDPGRHRVEVSAKGYFPAFREFGLLEGQKEQLSVDLVRDPAASKQALPTTPTPDTEAAPSTTAQEKPAEGDAAPQRTTPFLVASVGGFVLAAAGAGFGTYKALQGREEEKLASDSNRLCGPSCKVATTAHTASANKYYEASILPFVVGGAGLAAGVTFLILYLNTGSDEVATGHLMPWVTPNSVGVTGRF